MTRPAVSRFILSVALIAQGIVLTAQPWAGAPAFCSNLTALQITVQPISRLSANDHAAIIPLQLAGLPGAGAAPGKRILLTVRDDVFQNGSLRIAAGARAKGLIRAIRRTDTTLYLSIEPQTVQTADGPLVELSAEPVELEVNLLDAGARYWPFEAALAEAGQYCSAPPFIGGK